MTGARRAGYAAGREVGRMAVLTAALTRLRSDFNTRFPGRDKASDGWIGDYQHQQRKSGHNPDDTAGSQPEYTDPDSKAEVRAVDIDDDLRDPGGVTMQQCADALRTNERDRKRLAYIIYNRQIASQSSGWAWQPYSGDNPHTEHLHASGDPDYDDDDAEFTSITQIGDEGMTPEQLDDYFISRYQATSGKPLTVGNYLRSWPWTYKDSGFPPNQNMLSLTKTQFATVDATAKAVEVDEAELEQIRQAASEGAYAGASAAVDEEAIAGAIVVAMQAAGLDPEAWADAIEAGVRSIFADAGTPDDPPADEPMEDPARDSAQG